MSNGATYFDTSALVKLVLPQEAGAEFAAFVHASNSHRVTSIFTFPEARSAVSRRFRNRELTQTEWRNALARLDTIWPSFVKASVTDQLVLVAADLILRFPLTGADALQVATALALADESEITFVTWDRQQG